MCLQAIDGGFPQDALVDMTGALGEEVKIQELLFDDQLWKRMMKSNDKEFGPLLTAGIMGRNPDGSEAKLDTGLFGGHAYSITAVREVQKGMSRHVGGCATLYQLCQRCSKWCKRLWWLICLVHYCSQ